MSTPSVASTIETGVNTAYPSHWAQDRQGNLLRVNGIQRGSFWRGTEVCGTDGVMQLGITGPTAAPDVSTDTGAGGAGAGNYWCAYRYLDAAGTPSSLSATTCVTGVADDGFDWTGITKPTEARPTQVQLFRTTAGQSTTFYRVATLALADWVGSDLQYLDDNDSDAVLLASDADDILPLFNDDRSLCARRFEPPPNDMSVVVAFQGRHWYGVPLAIPGSTMAAVTDWETLVVGRYLYMEGNARPLQITGASGANLELEDETTQELDAASVWIHPGPDDRNALYFSYDGEPESVPPSQNVLHFNQNTDDEDDMRALIPWGMAMWICRDRHTLRYAFGADPRYDSGWRLVYARGCLNQRCFGFLDGVCYLMDQMGFWRMTDGGFERIDDQIGDVIQDSTIDFTKRATFCVSVEPRERVVRFHVVYASDSDDRPARALCYHEPTRAWHTETYPQTMGGSAKTTIGGEVRSVVGGTSGRILLEGEGTEDPDDTAIAWSYKSGMTAIPAGNKGDVQAHVTYPPTTGAETCSLAFYYDHNDTAETFKMPHSEGGASVAAGATAVSIDMQSGRSNRGSAPGFDRWPIHVRAGSREVTHRFVSLGLSGNQQDEAIRISSLKIGET